MIDLKLLKLETGDAIYERGETYFNENQNNNTINYIILGNSLFCKGDIKEYKCELQVQTDTNSIKNPKCSCIYFQKNNNTCKHIISLAMQINYKIEHVIQKNLNNLSTIERTTLLRENINNLNQNLKSESKLKALSVSEVTKRIKKILEEDSILLNLTVEGEISTFSPNRSGHIYFSIKDNNSLLSCTMFKWAANKLNFTPKTGDKVILKGNISLYEPRGAYQLIVKEMKKAGEGDLYAKFLELKDKLSKQGL